MLVVSSYHYIRPNFDTPYAGIFGMTPSQFENQLGRLSKIANFVSAADILWAIEKDSILSENILLLTFDDGLKEQCEYALPILDKMGIPAVFYINTFNFSEHKISTVHKIHLLLANLPIEECQKFIYECADQLFGKTIELVDNAFVLKQYRYDSKERGTLKYFLNYCLNFEEQVTIIDLLFRRTFTEPESRICKNMYLSEDDIIKLANREYLGSHSHRHIPLGLYSEAIIDNDIKVSMEIIKEKTGHTPASISYPYGSIEVAGELVQKKAKDNGFKFGFTFERGCNLDLSQPFKLSRFDCNELPGGKSALFKDQDFFAGISFSLGGIK